MAQKVSKPEPFAINPSLPYQFIDCQAYEGACCPHCGAEGKYIYTWAEYGVKRAAMAGCFAALTGHIKQDDVTRLFVQLAEKQAKNKPLTGYDRQVAGIMKSVSEGRANPDWAARRYYEIAQQKKAYAARKWGGR